MNTKKVIQFSIGPIGAGVLGLITLPILTWFFSQEDIGRVTMLQVTISFTILLFNLGLDQAYVREYHEAPYTPRLLKTALLPGLVLLLIVLSFVIFNPVLFSEWIFDSDNAGVAWVLMLSLVVAFLSQFLSSVLRMQGRGLAYSMSQLLPKLALLGLVGVYVAFAVDATFLNLILANLLSLSVMLLVLLWNTREEWIKSITATIDKPKLKEMLTYGFPLIWSGVAFWGLATIDRVGLKTWSTLGELAVYSVAISFAGVALILQSIFCTIWVPVVYKWAVTGENLEKIDKVRDNMLLVVSAIFVLSGLFSWVVTYILPPEYKTVQYLLVAALAPPLLYTLSEVTTVGIGITKKTVYALIATIGAFLVNLVGNYLLIPIYGAAGAAVSGVFAFYVFFVLRTEFSIKVWKPIPRVKLYSVSLALLALAAYNAVAQMDVHISILIWMVAGLVVVGVFSSQIKILALAMVKNR